MNENKFNYTYSAPTDNEKREIRQIRAQYQPKSQEEISLERLRALDNRVKGFPQAISLALGVIGLLVFGLGIALILHWSKIFIGILVALIGIVPISLAYPVHQRLFEREKEKYGDEILKISEELLKERE